MFLLIQYKPVVLPHRAVKKSLAQTDRISVLVSFPQNFLHIKARNFLLLQSIFRGHNDFPDSSTIVSYLIGFFRYGFGLHSRSKKRFAVSATRPTGQTRRFAVSVVRPIGQTRRFAVSAVRPTGQTRRFAVSAVRPTGQTRRFAVSVVRPTGQTQRFAVSAVRPTGQIQRFAVSAVSLLMQRHFINLQKH